MSNRLVPAVLSIWFCLIIGASAQMALAPLSGPQVRAELYGILMTGEYPDGAQWAERFNKDGSSSYSQDGQISKGTMTLNGNIWCFTYEERESFGGCFEVWKRGPNCFDFYATNNTANQDDRRFGRSWSARGWVSGRPKTCVSEKIS